jgi:enoyl-CoA hydratase/carnithine racemase
MSSNNHEEDQMSTNFKEILYEVRDRVATITINRPDRMNALTKSGEEEMKGAFRLCQDDDDIRVLVITGAGRRGFSTGLDVSNLIEVEGKLPTVDPGHPLPTPGAGGVPRALLNIVEKPVIAAVNGACAGAGYCLAMAADVRIGSENARFICAYLRRSLVAGGETWFLPRIAGLGAAMYHILNADEIGAEEAYRLNLLSKIVPADALADETFAFASKIAGFDPTVVKFTKRAIRKSLTESFDSVMEYVGYARRVTTPTGAGRNAMEAFLTKK